LQAERNPSSRARGGEMDCFGSLAMTGVAND
jgi:hypothetical protein